ncbi:SUMF1/EgtB/PvdO family nonheme iron enzyme [Pseudoalteromonas xiamenensis]
MTYSQFALVTGACLLSSTLYAGESIRPIEPIMVTIPAGSFEMGTLKRQSAQPVHPVSLNSFSLGKYEVTVKEFARFVEATNYPMPTQCRHELDGWFKPATKGNWQQNALTTSEFQPVVCIGWRAAKAYVDWLAKETGKPYRLPTEAEWEYAARAGTSTDYFFGDDESRTTVCEYANTADLYGESRLQRDVNTSYKNWDTGMANCSDGSAYASIVGMYKPNPFGVHDIVSNVLEFMADCYAENYDNASPTGAAYQQANCEERSTRGGSWHWNNWPHSFRTSIPDDFAGGVDGFRVAMDGQSGTKNKETQLFEASLHEAQVREKLNRVDRFNFAEPVVNLTLTESNGLVSLAWDKHPDPLVTEYRVYRNKVREGMFRLIAANINEPMFKEPTPAHQVEYTVVAIKGQTQSPYSEAVLSPLGFTQVPGKIEAEHVKSLTGASIAMSTDGRGDFNLSGRNGIEASAEFSYQLNVSKAGYYQLSYRVAAPKDVEGFSVYLDDKPIAKATIKNTGGYHQWQTQTGEKVYLPEGKVMLTLKSKSTNWKLNWFQLM